MLLGIVNTANPPSVTRAPYNHCDPVTMSSTVATQEVEVGRSRKPQRFEVSLGEKRTLPIKKQTKTYNQPINKMETTTKSKQYTMVCC